MAGVGTPRRILSDRYALDREIGRGAMGVVFRARDLRHGRDVAVKLLAESVAQAGAERFIAEIRTAAQLNHPHILAVHDSGEENGTLYYVMPLVDGESLRERLDRQRSLPVGEAVRIATEIAHALAYAHARGVVHRDVKPENILLDQSGHALLADFGLARALSAVANTRLTTAGLAIGSPDYMSPEQAAGAGHAADGRSDIYALGCVLFECLAGRPPFTADTVEATLHRHLTATPPSIRARRADVPPHVDRAIRQALAKSRDERISTAEEFAQALTPPTPRSHGVNGPPWRAWRSLAWLAAGSSVVAIAILAAARTGKLDVSLPWSTAPLDSMRIAVLPVDGTISAELGHDLQLRFAAALERWPELTVDGRELRRDDNDAEPGVSENRALTIAREQGAGRYLRAAVLPSDTGTVRLRVALHDAARGGEVLTRDAWDLTLHEASLGAMIPAIVDSLLFGRVTWSDGLRTDIGTRSYSARRAYSAGHEALTAWDLSSAEAHFAAAAVDRNFARARFWLAQVRNWRGDDPARSQGLVDGAVDRIASLAPDERQLALALASLGRNELAQACEIYRHIVEAEPRSFPGWYGLGECHRRDEVVITDDDSPSGWRFRSSQSQAVVAYTRAFEAEPRSHLGFRDGSYSRVREFLITRTDKYRFGRALSPDSLVFGAWPTLNDTLEFIPYLLGSEAYLDRQFAPETMAALIHQRRVFNDLAAAWVEAHPESPDAHEAHAIALSMLGDPGAVQIIREARRNSFDPEQQRRLAISEVWTSLKFASPPEWAGLTRARELADSLLSTMAAGRGTETSEMAALAALLGRPSRAASLVRARPPGISPLGVPESLVRLADALEILAALGGPADSITQLATQVDAGISANLKPSERQLARSVLLERTALLAFPARIPGIDLDTYPFGINVGKAQQSIARGDSATARAILAAYPERSFLTPRATTVDFLYPVGRTLLALGDTAAAIRFLNSYLTTLRWLQPGAFEDVVRAGGLIRAMALYAELAARTGDISSSHLWARAVLCVWTKVDPFLVPLVNRIVALQGGTGA